MLPQPHGFGTRTPPRSRQFTPDQGNVPPATVGDRDSTEHSPRRVPDDPSPSGLTAIEAIAQRYEVLGEAGRGGMGIVYRARDRETGEIVAVKVLKPEIAQRAAHLLARSD